MRSSFFSRPPLRLIWNTENFMRASAHGSAGRWRRRGIEGTRRAACRLLGLGGAAGAAAAIGHHVVELQAHLLAHGELGVAALAFATELLLEREDRLGPRQ